jgi:hypothetical protein
MIQTQRQTKQSKKLLYRKQSTPAKHDGKSDFHWYQQRLGSDSNISLSIIRLSSNPLSPPWYSGVREKWGSWTSPLTTLQGSEAPSLPPIQDGVSWGWEGNLSVEPCLLWNHNKVISSNPWHQRKIHVSTELSAQGTR